MTADREVIPPDESSLINTVAAADVSPGVRSALDSFAKTLQAGHVAKARPAPRRKWWERD